MKKKYLPFLLFVLLQFLFTACKSQVKQQEDELYSGHLQRLVKLTIISTPAPGNKKKLNLLLLNDGQDMDRFRVKEIVDSLYRKKLIPPLLVIAIHAGDRLKEYGVANYPDYANRGDKAVNYDAFVNDELFAFANQKAGIQKFNSVVMAGCSLGGLSAFDIAWNHPDKINKVGVFSGSFWWRDKDDKAADYSDEKDRIMLNKVRSSQKRPPLQYWFYAGAKEEEGDRDKDGIIDVIDDTKDLIELIKSKKNYSPNDIIYREDANGKHDYPYWSAQLPVFLIWAFGK
jgi:enterochelin esterase-like enzyme